MVHGYWSIDLEILHTTAVDFLPVFVDQLREVLTALESQDGGTDPPAGDIEA